MRMKGILYYHIFGASFYYVSRKFEPLGGFSKLRRDVRKTVPGTVQAVLHDMSR